MLKYISIVAAALSVAAGAYAGTPGVTVKFENKDLKEIPVMTHTISSLAAGGGREVAPVATPVVDGVLTFTQITEPMLYIIPGSQGNGLQIFAAPGEEIVIDVKDLDNNEFTISGSELMEKKAEIEKHFAEWTRQYRTLSQQPGQEDAMEAIQSEANMYLMNFVKQNPESSAVAVALTYMDPEEMLEVVPTLTAKAKESIYYPLAEQQIEYARKQVDAQKIREEMQSGNYSAPDFTFKNIEGKDVSLSDFKGKWVVIDFWGSWCSWCIKGIPELKAAYAKYSPELEVIGIACNDKEDAWRKAVDKYELPWVNLYNPERGGGQVLQQYGVEGFPTKVIVNPEGKIYNITVGENPNFYVALAKALEK